MLQVRINEIEITPLAAESMGVRSLATRVTTPDISITFDPSAALAFRNSLDPHPLEYKALKSALGRILESTKTSDAVTVSHYHYDHIRPGLTNYHYNFSSKDNFRDIYRSKIVLAKDSREQINPSQRRRAFYFQKDLEDIVDDIRWADSRTFVFGETSITFSPPLPHGPKDSRLGFVLSTILEHDSKRFLFAPDVQGPIERQTLSFLLEAKADVAIIGGPPIYLHKFQESHRQSALFSLTLLASSIPVLVIDHHLLRSPDWLSWSKPIHSAARNAGNQVLTMAEFGQYELRLLEAQRQNLYREFPPDEKFMEWVSCSADHKKQNPPPLI